jgi:hypothetical protein
MTDDKSSFILSLLSYQNPILLRKNGAHITNSNFMLTEYREIDDGDKESVLMDPRIVTRNSILFMLIGSGASSVYCDVKKSL